MDGGGGSDGNHLAPSAVARVGTFELSEKAKWSHKDDKPVRDKFRTPWGQVKSSFFGC